MIQILLCTLTLFALDAIWLGFIAKKMYIKHIGSLLSIKQGAIQANWYAAIVVYIALIVGIVCFVLPKANHQPTLALCWGGLFGLVVYATYDFTNLAVLPKWSLQVSIIDTLWGMLLCGLTSGITMYFTMS